MISEDDVAKFAPFCSTFPSQPPLQKLKDLLALTLLKMRIISKFLVYFLYVYVKIFGNFFWNSY